MTALDVARGPVDYRVRRDEQAPFWDRVSDGTWEPHSFTVLDDHLAPGLWYVDVGAWIGPLSLYAAGLGARCLAFEPDPVAFEALVANLALNPAFAARVEARPEAVAARAGSVRIGSITSGIGGDSMSSLLFADGQVSWEVPAVTLAAVLEAIPDDALGLVKIDVEGSEVELLAAAADVIAARRPPLYLSVHGRFWSDPVPRLRTLVELLAPYDVLRTPDGRILTPGQLLDDEHRHGLFEVLACDAHCADRGS
jgi:FkbM family methyltransferase